MKGANKRAHDNWIKAFWYSQRPLSIRRAIDINNLDVIVHNEVINYEKIFRS